MEIWELIERGAETVEFEIYVHTILLHNSKRFEHN
jgi:hypothetical protein